MSCSKTFEEGVEKMRSELHKAVDTICDKVKSKDEVQVHIGLKELEININKASLDTLFAHSENNNQESTPEQQQELRNTVHSKVLPGHEGADFPGQKPGPEQDSELEGLHNQSLGAQKPGESFGEQVQRLFQELVSRLQKIWQDVLACVQHSDTLASKVKSIWSEIEKFCSIVALSLSSLFQV